MSISPHKGWLSREGFTADVIGRILSSTVLAPQATIPLLLFAGYTSQGRSLIADRPSVFTALKALASIGLLRIVNGFLNRRALNNWTSDEFVWRREIALVTGGSDGIGQRIALLLARRGLKVVVLDVQEPKYHTPPNVTFYKCDITSSAAVAETAAAIRADIGEPTIIVNNAGILRTRPLLKGTEAETRLAFEVNTLSHYVMAREFLPSLIRHNHGMLVTVASQASHVACASMVDYAGTKAAALAFHEGIASELKIRYKAPKIRTVVIEPGFCKTSLIDGMSSEDTWFHPLLHPDTVAERTVEQILTGSSGRVILPGSTGFFAENIHSLPFWLQNFIRDRCEMSTRTSHCT
ncbi:TPA_exp: putative Short-chain dehydrogenase/reductase 2 [Trichophyton benhamiae CBS 112371]|nr:TPA_exp: putative Short-chain dehydrogenase/reductase 2 [Trichophyton benhamiae CBS 112371]